MGDSGLVEFSGIYIMGFNGDFMGSDGVFMGFNGVFMGFDGDFMVTVGSYPLVKSQFAKFSGSPWLP